MQNNPSWLSELTAVSLAFNVLFVLMICRKRPVRMIDEMLEPGWDTTHKQSNNELET